MVQTVRPPPGIDEPLRGAWLLAARTLWLLLAGLAAVVLVVALYSIHDTNAQICMTSRLYCELLGALRLSFLAREGLAVYLMSMVSLMALSWTLLGWLVFWRSPVSVASCLMSLGLVTGWATDLTGYHVGSAFVRALPPYPGGPPLGYACFFIIEVAAQISVVPMMLLLPDGRFGPRWAPPLAVFWGLYAPINVLYHGPFNLFAGSLALELLNETSALAMPLLVILAVRHKVRSAPEKAKTQLQTLLPSAWAFILAYVGFSAWMLLIYPPGFTEQNPLQYATDLARVGAQSALGAWFGVAVGTAVLRYNLFSTNLALSRALVYGGLSGALLTLYLGAIFGFGGLLGVSSSPWFSLLAAAVIVALFDPLRTLLSARVERSLYGTRGVPFRAFVGLSKQLQDDLVLQDYLPNLARRLSGRFGLPFVRLVAHPGVLGAETQVGERRGETVCFPISSQGRVLGSLEVGVTPGEVLAAEERTVLEAVAGQLGVSLRSLELSAELQAVQERLAVTRDEERRRLQRDLHDRLGPTLAAQSLVVSSARHLLASDAPGAERLLAKLEDDLWGTLEGVRRLVHSLTPSDLEGLGLCGALQLKTEALVGERLKLELHLPDPPHPYPAAAESAAYHIVSEAVANVVRHAHAQRCWVEVKEADGWLELSVTDDGVGLTQAPQQHRGLGLMSMRARAEELGGRFAVTASPNAPGVQVWASLPLLATPSPLSGADNLPSTPAET